MAISKLNEDFMPTDTKKPALGRGLDALLPSSRPVAAITVAVQQAADHGGGGREISLADIDRNPYQTRLRVDEAALNELAASIRATGVVQPVLVRPVTKDGRTRYQLIAGERRWLASQRAGKQTVPAVIKQVSNEQAMEMTIVENLQREDLNPLEQAKAFDRLSREFGLTQEQMAQRTGKDRASIANFLRLLKLPADVQMEIDGGNLTFGHAKVLMALEAPEAISKAAKFVITQSLSVRKTEELVYNLLHPVEKTKKLVQPQDPNVREAARLLQQSLGVRVEIDDHKGKGKIVLKYASLEDFDRIVEMLSK
jgi:ParB family transcriptional regulator, chromosome partitioning protein